MRLMAETSLRQKEEAEQERKERQEEHTEHDLFRSRSGDKTLGRRQQVPPAPFRIQKRNAASGTGIPQKVREHPERQGKCRPPPQPEKCWKTQPDPEQHDPRERVQRAAMAEFARQDAGRPQERLKAAP